MDIVEKLDELARKAPKGKYLRDGGVIVCQVGPDTFIDIVRSAHEDETLDFIVALANSWPEIRERLKLADAICEHAALRRLADHEQAVLSNWRSLRGEKGEGDE